jgi:hypothetical protein
VRAFTEAPGVDGTSPLGLVRVCTLELWHLYHDKASWTKSVDGKARGKRRRGDGDSTATAVGPDDGPKVLKRRRHHRYRKCRTMSRRVPEAVHE